MLAAVLKYPPYCIVLYGTAALHCTVIKGWCGDRRLTAGITWRALAGGLISCCAPFLYVSSPDALLFILHVQHQLIYHRDIAILCVAATYILLFLPYLPIHIAPTLRLPSVDPFDMSTAATRKPPSGGVGRISNSDNASSPNSPPSKGAQRASTPNGHARTRSVRAGTPVSARAAAARREGNASNADADARAEASAAAEDLQKRLESEEKQSEQYKKQIDVLQSKLDDSVKDSAKFEEKVHEYEEQIEALKNERKDATRQIREMETIYETEKSSILKEKEEMANKEEEMQTIIQRLKDSLAQRTNVEDDGRPSRQGMQHILLC